MHQLLYISYFDCSFLTVKHSYPCLAQTDLFFFVTFSIWPACLLHSSRSFIIRRFCFFSITSISWVDLSMNNSESIFSFTIYFIHVQNTWSLFMYKIHDPCTYIGRLFWDSFKEKQIIYTVCLQSKHAVFKENQFWLHFGMRKFITIHKQFPLMLRKFLLVHYHACLLCPLCSCWVLPLSSALVWS